MSLDPLNENPYQTSYQATSNTNSGASVPDGDSDLKATMRSIGRWQLFFAILGFIWLGDYVIDHRGTNVFIDGYGREFVW
jgi:hypothetical protein